MRPRRRGLFALFALMSLLLVQAEGLWASSACTAEMETSAALQMADGESSPEDCPMGHSGHSHEQDGPGSRGPACPLMPAGTTSCTGAVAMLPSPAAAAPDRVPDEISVASSDHAKDLLLAASLLRPPQA